MQERREGKVEQRRIPGTILEDEEWMGLESPVRDVKASIEDCGKVRLTA
jgi:hypothetical protein